MDFITSKDDARVLARTVAATIKMAATCIRDDLPKLPMEGLIQVCDDHPQIAITAYLVYFRKESRNRWEVIVESRGLNVVEIYSLNEVLPQLEILAGHIYRRRLESTE